jgi:hypothetical protein
MTTKARALLGLVAFSTTLFLAACGHYTCGATFGGGSTCSSSGTGGGGGGGTPPPQAFVYYVNQGSMSGKEVTIQTGTTTLAAIPNFSNPVIPTSYTIAGVTIAQKKFVYVPFGSTAQLFAYSIDTTGNLTAINGSPFSAPYASGMAGAGQPLISVITNPAGTILYIADAAASQIRIFSIDSTTGIPTELSGSPFSTAGVIVPWNLAIDGLGKFLYVTEGNSYGEGQQSAVFNLATNGAISGGTILNFNMWELQCDPSGKFAVGTTGENGFTPDALLDDHIYVFQIDPVLGSLTQVPGSPFVTANAPTAVRISPNGQFVYDFSISKATGFDGPLEGFKMDTTTGILTPLSGSPFASLSIPYGGYFDQSGAYMVFHEHGTLGVYNFDTATGIPTENALLVTGVGDLPFAVTDPN